MVKDEERDTGRVGTLGLRSWVDISKGACCKENGGKCLDSYKKGVFYSRFASGHTPTFWLVFSKSDLIRSCPCWRLQDGQNGFMTNQRQLTWLFLNVSETALVLPGGGSFSTVCAEMGDMTHCQMQRKENLFIPQHVYTL